MISRNDDASAHVLQTAEFKHAAQKNLATGTFPTPPHPVAYYWESFFCAASKQVPLLF